MRLDEWIDPIVRILSFLMGAQDCSETKTQPSHGGSFRLISWKVFGPGNFMKTDFRFINEFLGYVPK